MSRTNVFSPQGPDYFGMVKFLLTPFLESPDSLKVDCEEARNSERIWIRLAIESEEKGKVYGRGGRNIQAIRAVLATAAQAVGQSIYLDIFESENFVEESFSDEPKVQGISNPPLRRTDNHPRRKPRTRRPLSPRF